MKVLWHAPAPFCTTGYGTQSALFGPRINKAGYEVAFSAFYGLKGARMDWPAGDGQTLPIYPGGSNPYGNDVLGAHAQHWFQRQPGFIFLLTDPWVIDDSIGKNINMISWVPVDHDPLIPQTHQWFNKSTAYPLAMSKFGQRVLEAAGHTAEYCPHGFDPETFFPTDRETARADLGIPKSAFVVGMVAANKGPHMGRKCFGEALMAFSVFQKRHPDALLYLFTKMEDPEGENIPAMISALKIKALSFDQYGMVLGTPNGVVARAYNAFDVLLNPSRGEGFGCTLVEAQACGTPCITTNWSSMPEVAPVDVGNWSVEGQEAWTQFMSIQKTPSIEQLIDSLEQAYADSNQERLDRRNSVMEWAYQEYTADYVTEQFMIPALERIQVEFSFRKQLMVRNDDL